MPALQLHDSARVDCLNEIFMTYYWLWIDSFEYYGLPAYKYYAITDDGIGRKKAAELEDRSGKHKSMGMKITESRIAMMQKMNGSNKSVEIRDLVDADGSVAGTEVVLKIPIEQLS